MNNPNDNVKSQPGKKLDISPELYFKNWAFEIGSHYWEVFGVTQREWIDQAKAKPLREKRKLELISQTPDLTEKKAMSLAVKQIRPKVKGWGKSSPDKTNFSQ
ncbi:MAG: hypothetical protein HUJ13_10860, partial [Hydrogenovibrio crunogenus]|nr:hypothetical protein [Hydrogenovibrio crunogenus]